MIYSSGFGTGLAGPQTGFTGGGGGGPGGGIAGGPPGGCGGSRMPSAWQYACGGFGVHWQYAVDTVHHAHSSDCATTTPCAMHWLDVQPLSSLTAKRRPDCAIAPAL